jgi:hypothetical protein
MEQSNNIIQQGSALQYLYNYVDGKIPFGLKLGCDLDDNLVWKKNQLNMILGHDNVGKSYWMEWYFLALATNHELTFTLFMDENYHGKVLRDLVQMYSRKPFMDLTYKEIQKSLIKIEHFFKFVDNSRRYTPDELLDTFDKSNTDNYLIDPFNALSFPMSYQNNYDVLNDLKHFTKTGKTLFINTHPSSASGRRGATYPKGHDWEFEVMPPLKSDIEGGKAFSNKADDFVVIHRLIGSQTMWNYTMIDVVKVKDTDTGGKPTKTGLPIMCDYNFGLGFKINGIDVIKRPNMIDVKIQSEIFKEQEYKKKKENEIKINEFYSNKNLIPNNDFEKPVQQELKYVKPDNMPF